MMTAVLSMNVIPGPSLCDPLTLKNPSCIEFLKCANNLVWAAGIKSDKCLSVSYYLRILVIFINTHKS